MKSNLWKVSVTVTFGILMLVNRGDAAKGGVAVRVPPFVPVPGPQLGLQTLSPFQVIGFIQSATLDNPSDVFSGGTVVVNGITITVPRNTLFQMPATSLTWQELFKTAPAPYGLTTNPPSTGLALNDNPKPTATYEINVIGNRVINNGSDRYIAGLIFLSQQSLNQGQGQINFIDYESAEIYVGGALNSKTGSRIRINTPGGRYGKPDPNADPRFEADEDNPTVRSETGYPMCLPRFNPTIPYANGGGDDSLCPQRNRPVDPVTGAYQTIFTMPPPSPTLAPSLPDATQQTPFEIGDYVTFNGSLAKDSSGQIYLSAHTIVANLGIFTAPGTMPMYVAIDDMLIGAGGAPNPLFPQEAVEKLKVVAFSTDPTALVDVYAVDVDACGNTTDRFYGTMDVSGPPIGGVRGRGRLVATIGNFLPATREMRIASRTFSNGGFVDSVLPNAKLYANGLMAGQYHAPNFEFILPENLVVGSPTVPAPFQEFPFLVNGMGPYFGNSPGNPPGAASLGNLGQLSPWPGFNAPQPLVCGGSALNNAVLTAPIANAGAAQTVNSGVTVTLDGGASSDTNFPALPIEYTWLQTAGPTVTLNDAGFQKPYFTAPTVAAGAPPVVLTFSLAVSNGFASSTISTVNVTVVGQQNPVVNAGASQSVTNGSNVNLQGSAVDPNGTAGQPLVFAWTQVSGPTIALTNANSATATFTAPTLALGQPGITYVFKLTVTDKLGLSGSATTTVVVNPVPDRITITAAAYTLKGSRLSVTATDNVPGGKAVLTLHVFGQPDVVMTYDPTLNTYNVASFIVNPIPSSVSITSSFGGQAISGLTSIK